MTLLLKFFLAHILGDFVFQPAKWVADKQLNKVASRYLYFHVLVHAVALVVVLQFDWTYSIGVLSLVASHLLIDLAKVYLTEKIKTRVWFFLDQLAHIMVIVVVVSAYEPMNLKLGNLYAYPSILLLTAITYC